MASQRFLITTAIALVAPAAAAHAQSGASTIAADNGAAAVSSPNTASAPPGAQTSPTGPAGQEPANGNGTDEVVVVARWRAERLQDVPVSVTAVSAATLQRQGIADIRRLTIAVPGYQAARFGGTANPYIRGVGSNSTSLGDESNVAVYVDGIYQPNPFTFYSDFVAIDHVEVLRGPQGTLFGRNATGGLVNVITPDPDFHFHGFVRADYTFFHGSGEYRTEGYATGPITDTLAADVALSYRHNGNYIQDLVNGGNIGEGQSFSGRGKLLFRPSSNFQSILTYSHVQRDSQEDSIINSYLDNTVANTIPGTIVAFRPYTTAANRVPGSDGRPDYPEVNSRVDQVSLRNRVNLGFANLQTSHSLYDDRYFQSLDVDGSAVAIASNSVRLKTRTYSNEARLISNGENRLKYTLGLYQFHLAADGSVFVYNGAPPTYTTINTINFAPHLTTSAYAAYAEGSYDLVDRLSLTLGARYSRERRTLSNRLNGAALFGGATLDTGWRSKWTYRASLLYKFDDDNSVYVSYGTGFKSGVFNYTQTTAVPATNPETVRSIELGGRVRVLPWLRANASIFHSDYNDLQLVARTPSGLTQSVNAASARIKGGELEVQAQPSRSLSFNLALSILDAKFTSFPNAISFVPIINGAGVGIGNTLTVVDVTGRNLIRAPRFTLAGGVNWSHEFDGGRLGISANAYHSSRVYHDFANRTFQPPYTTLNGEVSWTTSSERLRFYARVANLTNEAVLSSILEGAPGYRAAYDRPRQITIGAEARF